MGGILLDRAFMTRELAEKPTVVTASVEQLENSYRLIGRYAVMSTTTGGDKTVKIVGVKQIGPHLSPSAARLLIAADKREKSVAAGTAFVGWIAVWKQMWQNDPRSLSRDGEVAMPDNFHPDTPCWRSKLKVEEDGVNGKKGEGGGGGGRGVKRRRR